MALPVSTVQLISAAWHVAVIATVVMCTAIVCCITLRRAPCLQSTCTSQQTLAAGSAPHAVAVLLLSRFAGLPVHCCLAVLHAVPTGCWLLQAHGITRWQAAGNTCCAHRQQQHLAKEHAVYITTRLVSSCCCVLITFVQCPFGLRFCYGTQAARLWLVCKLYVCH